VEYEIRLNVVSNPKMTTTKVDKKRAFETLTSQLPKAKDNVTQMSRNTASASRRGGAGPSCGMRLSDGPPLPLWERPDRIEDAIRVRAFLSV